MYASGPVVFHDPARLEDARWFDPPRAGSSNAAQQSDALAAMPFRPALSTFGNGGAGGAGFGGFGSGAGAPGGLSAMMNAFGAFVQAMFAQIAAYVQQLNGSTYQNGPTGGTAAVPEQYFTSAQADSVGDPHDAFVASAGDGTPRNLHWDDMASHRDLLTSSSFQGGYRVSTRVTGPAGNGVTKNASAAVVTNGGATCAMLSNDGTVRVQSYGRDIALVPGVATDLGNGARVTLGSDGSLQVAIANGNGGSITTRMQVSDGGVDVRNSAANVMLGGYLVEGGAARRAPAGY